MKSKEMEEIIINHLKNCDENHAATIGHLTFAIFGEKMARLKKDELTYNIQVFDLASNLETKGIVKNINRIPTTDKIAIMKASRWILIKS